MLLTILAQNVMIAPVVPPIPPSSGSISYYKDGSGNDLIEKQQKEKNKLEEQNNLVIAICKVYIECHL